MKTLKQEAKEYSTDYHYASGKQDVSIESFIGGATSKHVERDKLKFAIEQLKDLKHVTFSIINKIEELEKQLKELEK